MIDPAVSAAFTRWKPTKSGGRASWQADFTYQNQWSRDQYLTVEVTRTDQQGKTKTTGVISVTVRVIEIRTADGNGATVTHTVEGPVSTVSAPPAPRPRPRRRSQLANRVSEGDHARPHNLGINPP